MSEESQPLNSSPSDDEDTSLQEDGVEYGSSNKKPKGPLYTQILYSISLLVSLAGLSCGIWGWRIAVTSPFDKYAKKYQRESYEKNFYGMQSVLVFHFINIFWSFLNLRIIFKGEEDVLWVLNMIYDFLMWALFIAFGVLNMVEALWDRRLCDALDSHGSNYEELYKTCDAAMFRLLVVELVTVNLGILVAVILFILLVARCCTQTERYRQSKSIHLRRRIEREEQLLLALIERRRELEYENAALETGLNKPLPQLTNVGNVGDAESEITREEGEDDLIDMNVRDVNSPTPTTQSNAVVGTEL